MDETSNTITFQSLGLPRELNASLEAMNFLSPTAIQSKTIPLALEGNDILGSSQTGTGKTAAFLIPIVTFLLNNPDRFALVITPTRELAMQVMDVSKQLTKNMKSIKGALLIGGGGMGAQLSDLKKGARLIIGTPGRIYDHIDRKSLNLSKTGFLVLDETDRMLDMGFGIQIDAIVEHIPQERQTILFSATIPKSIERLSNKYLTEPKRIAIGASLVTATKVKTEKLFIEEKEKFTKLISELEARQGTILVFVNKKREADQLTFKLNKENQNAKAIHGDLRQNQRKRVIEGFRKKKYRILVATDVVARGLDIPHIEHVINFSIPMCPEDYIHRIGRTGRADEEGCALSFISPADKRFWRNIEFMLNPQSKESKSKESPRGGGSRKRKSSGGGNFFKKKSSSSPRKQSNKKRGGFLGSVKKSIFGKKSSSFKKSIAK